MTAKTSFKQLVYASIFPFLMVFTMWMVKIYETVFHHDLSNYGVFPQTLSGLRGIIFSPFLHSDWSHLSSNSVPLFLLGLGLFNFYRNKAWWVLLFIFIVSGVFTWILGRESYHIGASGVVYGLAFFILLSSIIRREQGMMAFSMLIIFLYGSIIWGFFPQFFPNQNISWEGHLAGAIAGVIIAIYYRDEGPKKRVYFEDETDTELSEDEYWNEQLGPLPEEIKPDEENGQDSLKN